MKCMILFSWKNKKNIIILLSADSAHSVVLTLCMLGNFACFFVVFFKKIFEVIRMSNSLDPDQDRHFVEPDLGPYCLQRLSAYDKKSDQGQSDLGPHCLQKRTFKIRRR